MSSIMKNELTEQEADLYDRQIRLWGLESQKKLRATDVLLIGINALGAEIAKNILLSGIKSLTFLDDRKVTEHDLLTNFLLPKDSLNNNLADSVLERARNLNPMVQIVADVSNIKEKNVEYFKRFTLIIATKLRSEQLISLNDICRKNSIQFLYGDVSGMFGFTFSDLLTHDFCEDVKQFVSNANKKRKHPSASGKFGQLEQETISVMRQTKFVPIKDVLSLKSMPNKIKPLSPLYFLARILLEFRDLYNREVSPVEKEADLDRLKEIRDKLFESFDLVSEDKLPNGILELVFDEVVPVCAIIGGVLAQEVIKAASHSEPPIDNMFFFDPNLFSGQIQCIRA